MRSIVSNPYVQIAVPLVIAGLGGVGVVSGNLASWLAVVVGAALLVWAVLERARQHRGEQSPVAATAGDVLSPPADVRPGTAISTEVARRMADCLYIDKVATNFQPMDAPYPWKALRLGFSCTNRHPGSVVNA